MYTLSSEVNWTLLHQIPGFRKPEMDQYQIKLTTEGREYPHDIKRPVCVCLCVRYVCMHVCVH